MAPDPVLDRLEAAFSKQRARLLETHAGRWALFVQPRDRRRKPEFVGCFDDEHQACEVGYRSTIGRRFLIKEVLEKDRVVSVPLAVPADHL
ncbi:MAG: hypothetical protein OXF75_00785 [Acidimicrobiaceae bacterium]|nr:hypothetical protein [Acidimicrobiaceae bacterium]